MRNECLPGRVEVWRPFGAPMHARRLAPVALIALCMVLPTLSGCLGSDAPKAEAPSHPFGFESAIAPGVWYHYGGGPEDPVAYDATNESALALGNLSNVWTEMNRPVWSNGTYYGTGFDTFEPTLGILSDGTIVFTNYAGSGTGTHIIRSQDQGQTWENVGPFNPVYPATGQVPSSNDPYVYVDPWTDRIVKFDMHALTAMFVEYSDDGGDSWSVPFSAYGYYSPQDHQSIASMPVPEGVSATYDTIYVFCINTGNSAAGPQCSRSTDGGHTWDIQRPGYPSGVSQCSGLHAHLAGGPDGWIYRGNPSCDGPAVYASGDGGYTWSEHTVSTAVGMQDGWHDHEVATAVDAAGNVYAMWIGDGMQPWVAWSTDHGETWRDPIMAAAPGVTEAGFPTIFAGDDGRVAFGYIGEFVDLGGWNGFMGIITDAHAEDPLITTVMANDEGDILDALDNCGDIRCGGFGDFIDIEIDDEGRPWIALAHNVNSEEAIIGTLTDGPKLIGDMSEPLPTLPAGGNATLGL